MSRNSDHVVVDKTTGNWCCRNCTEEREPPRVELHAKEFLRKMNGFVLLHGDCMPVAPPSKQVDLFRPFTVPDPAPAPEQLQPKTFLEMYTPAREHKRLRADLSIVLSNRGERIPSIKELEAWHPDTGIFQGVAYWAIVAIGWMNATECQRLGVLLPGLEPMPEKLRELIGTGVSIAPPSDQPPSKRRKGARPLTSGKKRR